MKGLMREAYHIFAEYTMSCMRLNMDAVDKDNMHTNVLSILYTRPQCSTIDAVKPVTRLM